jgi:hypothetical protein
LGTLRSKLSTRYTLLTTTHGKPIILSCSIPVCRYTRLSKSYHAFTSIEIGHLNSAFYRYKVLRKAHATVAARSTPVQGLSATEVSLLPALTKTSREPHNPHISLIPHYFFLVLFSSFSPKNSPQ